MPTPDHIDKITERLNLSPYQTYMLTQNGHKYNMDKLLKHGDILYAPYRCTVCENIKDYFAKFILGARADLIGADKILIQDRRGIKLYPSGFFKAGSIFGETDYLDNNGNALSRSDFHKIIRL